MRSSETKVCGSGDKNHVARDEKMCSIFSQTEHFWSDLITFSKTDKTSQNMQFLHKHGYFGSEQGKHRKVVRITHIDPYWPCIVITFLCYFQKWQKWSKWTKSCVFEKSEKSEKRENQEFRKMSKVTKVKKVSRSNFLSDRSTFVTFDQVVQLFSKRLHQSSCLKRSEGNITNNFPK